MAEVKWIKIVTDIFDDEKILLIEGLPEADAIIVIWFKLLCLAGKQNNGGVLVMNNRMPYTEEMLSVIFRRKPAVISLAIQTFEAFGMIEIIDKAITIPNWGKHQNESKLAEIREYNRIAKQKERERKQSLLLGEGKENVNDMSRQVIECQGTDIDREVDTEVDTEKDTTPVPSPEPVEPPDPPKPPKPVEKKDRYLEFVTLSQKEYDSLVAKLGSEKAVQRCIEILNDWKGSKGKKYKSDFYAIHSWVIERYYEELSKKGAKQGNGQSVADKFAKVKEMAEQEGWAGMI